MKALVSAACLSLLSLPAMAQAISEYTEYTLENDCTVVGRAPAGEGDWNDHVCTGVSNFPFVVRNTDGRETVTYGFAAEPGMRTFSPFNYANGTIEWRMVMDRDIEVPVAAIQRWFLADQNGEWDQQILVVSRVAQPDDGNGCAIAFIDAAADGANQRARQAADQLAADFTCGSDAPMVEDGIASLVPLD